MDEFKMVVRQAVDAALEGDAQALWIAQILLAHLREHMSPRMRASTLGVQ